MMFFFIAYKISNNFQKKHNFANKKTYDAEFSLLQADVYYGQACRSAMQSELPILLL
jgi:hypothetical protein